MNGIENITKRIAEETDAAVKKIIAEAEAEAAEIREEYEKKSEKVKADALLRGEKAAEERVTRLSGAAELEVKKAALSKKQELISAAFEAAVGKLEAHVESEREDILSALALRAANGGKGEIILSKADRDAIGKNILAKCASNKGITLSDETREISGLILRDGASEVNCTFPVLVAELRESLSREVADILFG